MHGDDVTAGGGCGAHCAVRQGSSDSADSAAGKFWGSREQPGAGRRLGGGVEWACRRAEGANTASIALHGMGQQLVAVSALLVQAIFEQMSPLIFGGEACCQKCRYAILDQRFDRSENSDLSFAQGTSRHLGGSRQRLTCSGSGG
jgi:hypothetical protein